MGETRIKLTLGKLEREVSASTEGGYLVVYGIALRTTSGKKTHSGYVCLGFKAEAANNYSVRDIVSAGYRGMRGNGHGSRSQFGYIGFFPE